MRIKSKKRFYTVITILLLILFAIIFCIVDIGKKSNINLEGSTEVLNNKVLLSVDKDGSIDFEENEYYQKYVINTKKVIDCSKFKLQNGYIIMTFQSGDIDKPFLKGEVPSKASNIFIDNKTESNKFTIAIKEGFSENNKVHTDAYDKNKIIVLIAKEKTPYKYKVMIDPGHGGRDPGNQYKGSGLSINEKDLNLDISLMMVDKLTYEGCQVKLTRDKDIELDKIVKTDLLMRADLANALEADIFISIHIDSFDKTYDKNYASYNGVTTYYYPDPDKNSKLNASRKNLAEIIQKNAVLKDNWKDRGTATGQLSVLHHTNMAGALIECGFLTNAADRGRLANRQVLSNLSQNIDSGLMEFLKSK